MMWKGVKPLLAEDYLEKVYAGFLGMNVGIRLGAPVEPIEWTEEKIQLIYGDINGYLKAYKTFSSDDDANGPVFFIRALYDDAKNRELEAEDVGKAWLNYTRDGIGMFWWGGEGISTEHTVYNHLKNGIPAPKSGSAELNGIILAEQIGGQIFIDTWGLLFPYSIEKAADYAGKAASVSHDKNGLYGARFMAACIAKAFTAKSIEEIIVAGLSTIPSDSQYTKVSKAVIKFHGKTPDNFRSCRKYLEEEWGYDKYSGVCHIIPNAGVCILALLYGDGDFSKTIEIATMCGWDTDCNAGNIGTILGVYNGIDGIPAHYRQPINDFIVTSSVSGYLNVLDIPTFSKELALLGYRLANIDAPKTLVNGTKPGQVFFDFLLPGSTHGFRTNNSFKTRLRSTDEIGYKKNGSLEVMIDRMTEVDRSKVFYKPFYRRSDFNDEKYEPVMAPTAYSGQTVSAMIYLDQWRGREIILTPYIRNTHSKEEIMLDPYKLENNEWNKVEFVIPRTDGALIDEVGYVVSSPSKLSNRAFGRFFIGEFHIFGNSVYQIDFTKQVEQFKSITPFAHNRGKWSLQGGDLNLITDGDCSSYSGNYYSENMIVEMDITPISGESHFMIFRAQGIKRHYLVGFDGQNQVSLVQNDFGIKRLVTVPYEWNHDERYALKLQCKNEEITFSINGVELIRTKDSYYNHGMFGYGCLEKGEANIHSFNIEELNN